MFLVLRVPIWSMLKNGQSSITVFSKTSSDQRQIGRGGGFIKRKAKPVSSQPLNAVSEFLSGFQLHHTDHLLSFQANERVGAK